MAWTASTFVQSFPEFRTADSALLTYVLANAANAIDPIVWGEYYDRGVALRAAMSLAQSPNGTFARLGSDPVDSPYRDDFRKLERIVTLGMRVF